MRQKTHNALTRKDKATVIVRCIALTADYSLSRHGAGLSHTRTNSLGAERIADRRPHETAVFDGEFWEGFGAHSESAAPVCIRTHGLPRRLARSISAWTRSLIRDFSQSA